MTLHILHLNHCPIYTQLQIEEALLRLDNRNILLINEGSDPAIVLGISGKVEELVDLERLKTSPIPLIRRYSGGGTVVVDSSTLFVSFICEKSFHSFPIYPEPLMRWSGDLYAEAFQIEGFHLRENDYAIGSRKCGGNAQYLRKERWVHHTTFLWDYMDERMQLLKHPRRTPSYRQDRPHHDFVCKLKDYCPSEKELLSRLLKTLETRYRLEPLLLDSLLPLLKQPHRKSSEILTPSDSLLATGESSPVEYPSHAS